MEKKLYEINQEIMQAYEEAVDQETGEIVNPIALEKIKALEVEHEIKLKSIRWIVKKLEAEIELAKVEKQRINQVQKAMKNNVATLKDYVLANEPHESNKLLGINFRHNIEYLDIPNEKDVPQEYMKPTAWEPDKEKIKEAINNGQTFSWASIKKHDTVSFGKVADKEAING